MIGLSRRDAITLLQCNRGLLMIQARNLRLQHEMVKSSRVVRDARIATAMIVRLKHKLHVESSADKRILEGTGKSPGTDERKRS